MATKPDNETAQLQLFQKGGPLRIVKIPIPTLSPGQVLVRQQVVALNGLDCKQRDLGILISKWPYILGVEGAGIVEAVGPRVNHLQPGDEVTAWMAGREIGEDWGGAYQEHVVMPEWAVAKKPKNIGLVEAASLPIGYVSAIMVIYGALNIPLPYLLGTSTSGDTPSSVLILGGSSATGAAAVQLLRLAYPSLPIFATSSPKNHAHVASRGATRVFDYHSPSVVSDIKTASPGGRGVDMIIDCVSAGASQTDICDVLDPSGSKKYASLMTGVEVPVPQDVTKFDVIGSSLVKLQDREAIVQALTRLVEEDKYKLPVPVRVVGHGLEQLPSVMDEVMSVSCEKLVVTL